MGEYMSDLNYFNIYGLLFYIATVFLLTRTFKDFENHHLVIRSKSLCSC